MSLDLRIPMGMLFTMVGAILTAFGLATRENTALYAKSLGIDANLWWGIVLLVFGITMLTLGRRGQMRMLKEAQKDAPSGEDSTPRRGH
jgi:hypothetical protein